MSQTKEVTSKLAYNSIISVKIRLIQCCRFLKKILMHCNASERIGVSIQEKSFYRIHPEISESDFSFCRVFSNSDSYCIQIWVIQAVPKMWIREIDIPSHFLFRASWNRYLFFMSKDSLAFCITQCPHHYRLFRLCRHIADHGLYLCDSKVISHAHLRNMKAIKPMLLQGEVYLRAFLQPYRIMNTTVLVEVGSKRNSVKVLSILACNLNLLVVLSRNIHIERSISSAVIA